MYVLTHKDKGWRVEEMIDHILSSKPLPIQHWKLAVTETKQNHITSLIPMPILAFNMSCVVTQLHANMNATHTCIHMHFQCAIERADYKVLNLRLICGDHHSWKIVQGGNCLAKLINGG